MRILSTLLLIPGLLGSSLALAEPSDDMPPAPARWEMPSSEPGLGADIKAYVTSPFRWDAHDWLYFGGTLAAVGLAHHFDAQVRDQYSQATASPHSSTYELQDFAPTAVLLVGTWGAAWVTRNSAGEREGWAMLEAALFAAGTGYGVKYLAGRERPSDTASPDQWRQGGSSFPSVHSTVAFAVGTVLAESGSEDSDEQYRWLRRVLGYGVGLLTSYERVRHNQHWLSDTVAGAAIGVAAARFTLHRREGNGGDLGIGVVPMSGGAMLTWSRQL